VGLSPFSKRPNTQIRVVFQATLFQIWALNNLLPVPAPSIMDQDVPLHLRLSYRQEAGFGWGKCHLWFWRRFLLAERKNVWSQWTQVSEEGIVSKAKVWSRKIAKGKMSRTWSMHSPRPDPCPLNYNIYTKRFSYIKINKHKDKKRLEDLCKSEKRA